MLEQIGQGQCAAVYKARWRGTVAVAKVLKGAAEYQAGWTLASARADLVHEISVLCHLRHPNLVLFLGACIDSRNVVLLNEYLDGGSLEDHVTSLRARHKGQRARVPRMHCARWGVDLAQALTFLHQCNPKIIHRDLKPANLLLTVQGCLKVTDFGLSSNHRHRAEGEDSWVMTGRTGTIRYMAPEAMKVDKSGNSNYNEKVDCYSAAMILWYMCMADPPFGDLSADLIMQGAAGGLRPDLSSIRRRHGDTMANTIQECWEADPAKRFSAETMLRCMRGHLDAMEATKARRRLPSLRGSSILQWASSAASKLSHAPSALFRRSSGAGPSPKAKEQGAKSTVRADKRVLVDVAAHEQLVDVAAHEQHAAHPAWMRSRSGLSADGGMDGTNTTTGTWSLDNTTNTQMSLDNTAQTTTSVRSDSDDWFSQVTDERLARPDNSGGSGGGAEARAGAGRGGSE
jgi:serine/threonine protein kinase